MKHESSGENSSSAHASGIGCFTTAGIAGVIALGIASQIHELARLVNILLHPGAFLRGIGQGFADTFQTSHGLLIKLVVPVIGVSVTLLLAGSVIFIAALTVASLRKNRAKVFISYHRSMWDNARALAEALRRSGIEPLIVPFQSDPEHDQLLDKIYALIKQADFVVCLPGLRPSFVEHEVTAAIMLDKSLFILLPQNHAGTPNTAQHSYPVLHLDRLANSGFQPLVQLMLYLHGNLSSTFRLYFTPTRLPALGQAVGGAVGASMFVIVAAYVFITMFQNLREILYLNANVEGYLWGVIAGVILMTIPSWLALALTGNFALGGITTIFNRSKAVRQTRRLLRDGKYSYPVLFKLFRPTKGLLKLLKPFFRHAPSAYHQVEVKRVS